MTTPPTPTPAPTVAVCIASHKRPHGLAKLIRSIDAQVFEGEAPSIEIIVVQNDEEGTASRVVPTVECRWPVRVVEEPRAGISYARNTSIRATSDSVEWLVFVDDDEHASDRWLEALLACQREHGCDVVAGPIIGLLPSESPAWIEKGGFFQRARFPTGTRRPRAASGNTLARRSAVIAMNTMFDDRGAQAGGSDTLLFRRMHLAGHTIIWCDEAVAYEDVPPSRANAPWIYKRAFRIGTNIADHERELRGFVLGSAVACGIAATRCAQGLLMMLPAIFAGKHAVVRAQRWIAYAAGLIMGVFGVSYQEYRRSHGE